MRVRQSVVEYVLMEYDFTSSFCLLVLVFPTLRYSNLCRSVDLIMWGIFRLKFFQREYFIELDIPRYILKGFLVLEKMHVYYLYNSITKATSLSCRCASMLFQCHRPNVEPTPDGTNTESHYRTTSYRNNNLIEISWSAYFASDMAKKKFLKGNKRAGGNGLGGWRDESKK